jgi:TolA-binding protein
MQVTERGAPEADIDLVLPLTPAPGPPVAGDPTISQVAPATSAAPPPSPFQPPAAPSRPAPAAAAQKSDRVPDAGAEGLDPFDQAVNLYRAGHYVDAQLHFERISRGGGQRAAEAALYAAQTTRNVSGCAPAVSRFERVRGRFPGSGSAYEASWRAAKCLQQLGDVEAARQTYESLLQVGAYADRARQALANLGVSAPDTTPTALPPIALHDPPATPSALGELESETPEPVAPPEGTQAPMPDEPKPGREAPRERGPDAGAATNAAP